MKLAVTIPELEKLNEARSLLAQVNQGLAGRGEPVAFVLATSRAGAAAVVADKLITFDETLTVPVVRGRETR